jgi:hypothetical protein
MITFQNTLASVAAVLVPLSAEEKKGKDDGITRYPARTC